MQREKERKREREKRDFVLLIKYVAVIFSVGHVQI